MDQIFGPCRIEIPQEVGLGKKRVEVGLKKMGWVMVGLVELGAQIVENSEKKSLCLPV